ncbi:MAG: hypothetical protein LBH82_03700 [Bacteroidales bacterium]|jgi:cellulose synthase/poly-beta-1,6-N-acetylglucosamine synthase-like glycosyltransferase|nr:hypothetical protein [Bacteroidales bacterium]
MQTVYIAIPAMDEKDTVFQTLHCIAQQQCECPIKVFVCVNQPESWWEDEEKVLVCENNRKTMDLLQNNSVFPVEIIDCSSKGNAWKTKKAGVGQARKALTDKILSIASDDDIFISMDADTLFESDYCQTVADNFRVHLSAVGMAVPYYHKKNHSETESRAMLRYELYMRNYNVHLLQIGSPYAYTALGSAICCRVKACKAVGGFDTQTSGEDFYFLQKLCKYGKLLRYNSSKVYPATRFSSRVPFGTGTAVYNGISGDWHSYPIFHHSGFEIIRQLYRQIERLFYEDFDHELLRFLQTAFPEKNSWKPLRENYKTLPLFTKAFHTKVDGLQIFRFLRHHRQQMQKTDEECLSENIKAFRENSSADPAICRFWKEKLLNHSFSFEKIPLEQLDDLRDCFMRQESIYQQDFDRDLLK